MSHSLGERLTDLIGPATVTKTGRIGLDNAEKNRKYFGKTIDDLPDVNRSEPEGAAIVMVGGPSLRRIESAAKVLASGFTGDIIVSDGALGYCLRNGLVPNYVLTLDPGALGRGYRLLRWFGDTQLETRPEDDYFTRQDLDPDQRNNHIRVNQELIDLVNRHAKDIKAVFATSATPLVTRRCVEAGMGLYWWNPIYDDYDKPNSISRELFESNHIPCMQTGGNVATAAWIFAHAVLKRKHVAMVGMDLGYTQDTPLKSTQYYYELIELLGEERAKEAYFPVYNPYLDKTWYIDPTFNWIRIIFLDLAKDADCITYNCTEAGTLFGEPIRFIPLAEFLAEFGGK